MLAVATDPATGAFAIHLPPHEDYALAVVPEAQNQGIGGALIQHGLQAGESVIEHPGDRIADGVRITQR